MTSVLTNVVSAVATNATPVVQLVCCKCATCVWVSVSQIVIAAFAVISGGVAIFKYFSEKNRCAPKLTLKFEDNDHYSVVRDEAAEEGLKCKVQTFLLRLDNIGSCPAKDCKVRVERVSIVSGNKLSEVRIDDAKSTLLGFRQEKLKWPLEINNGDGVDLEICKIATNNAGEKGATTSGLSSAKDDACIHVLNDCGVLEILHPHQNHIRICVKIMAAMFTPKKYEFDIEWKGHSIAAIGTAASYVVGYKEVG